MIWECSIHPQVKNFQILCNEQVYQITCFLKLPLQPTLAIFTFGQHIGKSADPLDVSEGVITYNFISNLHIRNTNDVTFSDDAHYWKPVCLASQPDTENMNQRELVESS